MQSVIIGRVWNDDESDLEKPEYTEATFYNIEDKRKTGTLMVLPDTGAEVSLMSECDFVKLCGREQVRKLRKDTGRVLYAANETPIDTHGDATFHATNRSKQGTSNLHREPRMQEDPHQQGDLQAARNHPSYIPTSSGS